jgi:antimicrobial peptide system SdpB family protein
MLATLGRWGRRWGAGATPWTNVYGVARSLLAGTTALTLLLNQGRTLFRPGAGVPDGPLCEGARGLGLFCVAGANHLELARWLAIGVLVVVASGWRPRLTGVLHWWVSFSFQANALVLDGGDSVTAVLALLLIPVTLTDPRRWHWQAAETMGPGRSSEASRLIAQVALLAVRLQVAGIYFHAAVAKFAVKEWADGTMLYYVLDSPMFGAAGWRRTLLWPVLTNGTLVALLTWSVLLAEYLLSTGLIVSKRYRGMLLGLGLSLHAGILLFQGLASFSLAMFAALILYLRPVEQEFHLGRHVRWRRRPLAESLTSAPNPSAVEA